jgi:hypothetical protein
MSVSSVGPRSRGSEFKVKLFKPSQRRQASNHRLGGNVSGIGNIGKGKTEKLSGGQK